MTPDPTTPAATSAPAETAAAQLPELAVTCPDCDGRGTWYDPDGVPEAGIEPGLALCAECDGLGWELTEAGLQLRAFLRRVLE